MLSTVRSWNRPGAIRKTAQDFHQTQGFPEGDGGGGGSILREFVENSRHLDPRRVRNGGPELRLVALIRWIRWKVVDPEDPGMNS